MKKSVINLQCFCHSLLLCVALCVSSASGAQDFASVSPGRKTVSGTAPDQSVSITLEQFMQRFQRTYNIYFSYETDALKKVMVVYPLVEEKPMADPAVVLKKVLTPAGLTYNRVNDVYIIKRVPEKKIEADKKPGPLAFVVKGTVKDANGPLGGVTVSEKDRSNATTTDINGNFELSVSYGEAI